MINTVKNNKLIKAPSRYGSYFINFNQYITNQKYYVQMKVKYSDEVLKEANS